MFSLVNVLFMKASQDAIVEREDEHERDIPDEESTVEEQASNKEELLEQTEDTSNGSRSDRYKDENHFLPVDYHANGKDEHEVAEVDEVSTVEEQANNKEEFLFETSEGTSNGIRNNRQKDEAANLPFDYNANKKDEHEVAEVDEESTVEEQANNKEELFETTEDTSNGSRSDRYKDENHVLPVDYHANGKGAEEANNDVHAPENDCSRKEATAKKLLFVFEYWNETAASMIKHFCAKSEICSNCECYSTTLDPELGENIKENAKAAGVTLIYPQQINISKQDSTHLNLLPYLILYYKHHNPHLNEVTYVIGCRQTTERAAKEIKESIFPKAELHYVDASCVPPPPAALFLYTEWNKNHLGLSQCHRTLVQDLCARKVKTREILTVYVTVNDFKITEEQKKDSKLCGVILIPRQRKSETTKDSFDIDFLLHYETFYPCLRDLKNIQYIVGYAPKTAEAAIQIKKKFFPKSKLYLINHKNPDDQYQSSRNSQENLNQEMLDMAAEADVLISIGPSVYDYYENEYRALAKKPHKELVPKPRALFFIENVKCPDETVKKHVILSYGKINRDNVNQYKKLAEEISKCGKVQAELGIGPPKWRICCLSPETDMEWESKMAGERECAHMQLKLYKYCSAEDLVVHLKQAHMYVTTPFSEDFPNLEALAIGLPLLTHGNSELSTLLEQYFNEEGNPCIVSLHKEWSQKLCKGLGKLDTAFERAAVLKSMYKDGVFVAKSYARFAALFLPKADFKSLDVVISMANLEPEHANFEQKCRKGLNIQAAECQHEVAQNVVQGQLGEVPVLDLKTGCLKISIGLPNLLKLYRLEAGCKCGSFAKAFDPVLLTDEMRNEADKVGIKLKLKATYDQERFEEVELFFLNRDGGGVEPTEISEESEDLVLTAAQQRLLAQLQAESDGDEDEVISQTQSSNTGNQHDVCSSTDVKDYCGTVRLEELVDDMADESDEYEPAMFEFEDEGRAQCENKATWSSTQTIGSMMDREGHDENNKSELKILQDRLEEELIEKSELQKQCEAYRETAERAENQVAVEVMRTHSMEKEVKKLRRELELLREKTGEATKQRIQLDVDKQYAAEETASPDDFVHATYKNTIYSHQNIKKINQFCQRKIAATY